MMTLPSCGQLIDVIRAELRDGVAPAAPDRAESLTIIDGLLESIATRAESEIAWMLEEIDAIAKLADRSFGAPASMRLSDVRERYHEASQVLADVVDANEKPEAIQAVLNARVAHEAEVRGSITLVGRG